MMILYIGRGILYEHLRATLVGYVGHSSQSSEMLTAHQCLPDSGCRETVVLRPLDRENLPGASDSAFLKSNEAIHFRPLLLVVKHQNTVDVI